MSKKLVEEIIWEQLAPVLEELAPSDAELLTEGEDLASADPKKLLKMLSALKISQENWGKSLNEGITNKDREIFRMHAKRLGGNSVEDKLKSLGAFMEQDEEVRTNWGMQTGSLEDLTNIGQLISNIVLIKTISKILNQFEAESAGYIMESFFAALGGGERRGGKETIVDFEIGDKLYSSKILSPSKGFIAGSFDNLKKALMAGKTITYFVGLKRPVGEQISLQFYSQEVTRDNFFEWMTAGDRNIDSTKRAHFKYIKTISQPEQPEKEEPKEQPLEASLLNVMYSMDSAYKKLKGKGALETSSVDSPPIKTFFLYILTSLDEKVFKNLHKVLEGKMKGFLKAEPALLEQLKEVLKDKDFKNNINTRLFELMSEKGFKEEVLKNTSDPPRSMKQVRTLAENINNLFKKENVTWQDLRQGDAKLIKDSFKKLSDLLEPVLGEEYKEDTFKLKKSGTAELAKSLGGELDQKHLEYLSIMLLNYFMGGVQVFFNMLYKSIGGKKKKLATSLPLLEEAKKNPVALVKNAPLDEIPIDTLLKKDSLKGFIDDARAQGRLNDLLSGLQFKGDLAKINLKEMTMVASINIGEDYLFRIVQKALEVKKEVLEENVKLIQELQTQLSNITVNLNKFYEDFDTQSASDAKGNADNISNTLKGTLPESSKQTTPPE